MLTHCLVLHKNSKIINNLILFYHREYSFKLIIASLTMSIPTRQPNIIEVSNLKEV